MRIAILADIHYSSREQKTCGVRETGFADTLLLRAVVRLNRLIKPDLTILAGDMVNAGAAEYGRHDMEVVADALHFLKSPMLLIPGNHDGPVNDFYQLFPRPERIVQYGDTRIVVNYDDAERPGYNAWRTPEDIDLIQQARSGFGGHIITLQHVPCLPEGSADYCPYNYTNASAINAAEAANGVLLSISGHYHKGVAPFTDSNGVTYFAAPALCETPFTIRYFDLDETTGAISWHYDTLRLPPGLNLVDTHIHTHLAYCNENLDIDKTRYLANAFGLKSFMVSEHSGHLLHSRENYGLAQCQPMPTLPEHCRGDVYFREMTEAGMPPERIGLEADICHDGSFLAHPNDLARAGFLIGAIHEMPCFRFQQNLPDDELRDLFLRSCEQILKNGCMSLAHPFRIFRRSRHHIPDGCFEPLVRLLKEYNTAVEINFHTNEPPVEFFRMAIQADVKITLGSDTHNLWEIGDFALALELLRQCGVDANLNDVLLPL